MAIRNKRNNQSYSRNNQGNFNTNSNNSTHTNNGNLDTSNSGQQPKGQGTKKNKPSASYEAITCWFCNKKGHTQLECRTRIKQGKPLTWKNKEVKSKFHSKKIMMITDFGDMEEAKEWIDKIETEAKQTEKPSASSPDFQ